jgi:hypothetical protein
MRRTLAVLGFLGAGIVVQADESVAQPVNPVLLWNKTLLVIVRTPGAQPATIHPTRSFAIMHAAIYDAVNAIDRGHSSYAIELTGVSRLASQDAAAATAAHEVLVTLYPQFQAILDVELDQSLASLPEDEHKAEAISVGQTVAGHILNLRRHDGSGTPPSRCVLATNQETTSQRLRIFRPSLNSRIGPAWCLLLSRMPISFVPALPRPSPANSTPARSTRCRRSGSLAAPPPQRTRR